MSTPHPKILCASLGLAPIPRGKKEALTISASLHSIPTASSQDFRSRNYRLRRALWKPLPCRGSFPLPPPGAAFYALLTRHSVDRAPPPAASTAVNPGLLEALLLELEAPLQSAHQGPRSCSHGDMPQAHRLRPPTRRLWLSGHYLRLHYDSIARGGGKPVLSQSARLTGVCYGKSFSDTSRVPRPPGG